MILFWCHCHGHCIYFNTELSLYIEMNLMYWNELYRTISWLNWFLCSKNGHISVTVITNRKLYGSLQNHWELYILWSSLTLPQTGPTHFFECKCMNFCITFRWGLYLSLELTTFQHWFRLWFGIDQWWLVSWRIYASLGLNELLVRYFCYLTPLAFCNEKSSHINFPYW